MRAKFLPVAAAALLFAMAHALAGVKEPTGLWTGPMHGETPPTLAGATVVNAAEVAKLKAEGALLIDVAEAPPKPPGASPDMPWLPVHMSIPGAVWLAGGGFGDASPEFQRHFGERLAALSGGDKGRPMLVFCHARCWGSWNAAKRALMLGYAKVFWFPGGVEAWQDRYDAAQVEEDAKWNDLSR
ncbi:rhodanese-like domain-containing protein [Rhodoblastus sp.]|uniref:rhodanese-like domain-containing protein n=1 Tax=Rhodoblastus sp. TaxID=1962975 RepID=UPI003F9DB2FB